MKRFKKYEKTYMKVLRTVYKIILAVSLTMGTWTAFSYENQNENFWTTFAIVCFCGVSSLVSADALILIERWKKTRFEILSLEDTAEIINNTFPCDCCAKSGGDCDGECKEGIENGL